MTVTGIHFGTSDYSIKLVVGSSKVEQVTWTSDTTLTLVVPPGIGEGLPLDVRAGRFQYGANDFRANMLDGLFTYDGYGICLCDEGNVERSSVAAA